MGLFSSREEIRDVATEDVVIPEDVARVIPDAGEYLLWWLGPADDSVLKVAAHVDALRGENGWISLNEAGQFGISKWENGPLTFLTEMTGFDSALVPAVWATHGLRRADKRALKENAESVLRTQGHAAAAAWAIAARPGALNGLGLDLEFLADQLVDSWSKQLQYRSNGDVIKAFKKWRR